MSCCQTFWPSSDGSILMNQFSNDLVPNSNFAEDLVAEIIRSLFNFGPWRWSIWQLAKFTEFLYWEFPSRLLFGLRPPWGARLIRANIHLSFAATSAHCLRAPQKRPLTRSVCDIINKRVSDGGGVRPSNWVVHSYTLEEKASDSRPCILVYQ